MTLSDCFTYTILIGSHTRVNAMHSKATIMRSACIKMLLAHVCLPTQTPKSQYYSSFWYSTSTSRKAVESLIGKSYFILSFWRSTSVSCEMVQIWEKIVIVLRFLTNFFKFEKNNGNFSSVSDVRRLFRAERVQIWEKNGNFSSVFDVRRPFRAKGLRRTPQNRNFTSVFDVRRPFRAKRLKWTPQNHNYLSFGRSTSISCERVAFRAVPPP